MSVVLESNQTTQTVLPKRREKEIFYPESHKREKEIFYPESHKDDMGESSIHYKLISYFFNALQVFFSKQSDTFVAANMNLYYRKGTPRNYYTPDVMIAFGVSRKHQPHREAKSFVNLKSKLY